MAEPSLPQTTPELDRLQKLVIVLRDYLMDTEEVNHLIEGEEYTDNQLRTYILLALDYYNTAVTPLAIKATMMDFPSLSLWLDGASIFALKSAIHKYNRNAFQYNDAGTQVAVEEKAGEYERTLGRLIQEFRVIAGDVKQNINLEGCYGGFSSEYLDLYIVGRRGLVTS